MMRWITVLLMMIGASLVAQGQAPVKVSAAEAAKLLIQPAQKPEFPSLARAMRQNGVVHLELIVDAKGAVTSIKDLDNTPMDELGQPKSVQGHMVKNAKIAVGQYHYHPYLLNGRPVAMRTTVDIVYRLN
jgi:hypothetical protein